MNDPLATAEFLIKINQKEEAKKVLDIMKPFCNNLIAIDSIGKLYAEVREFNDCLELALKAHKTLVLNNEQKFDIRTNIIRAYLNLNKPLEALKYIKINLAVKPNDHPTRMDLAMANFLLNKKIEGEAILRKILTEKRTEDINNRVNFNLGTYELAGGNFKTGLRKVLLDGRKLNIWHKFTLAAENLWEGTPQPGRTILLCAEGGIGDEIISVRFQKHFKDIGMHPIWYTDRKDLAKIFERNGFSTITSLDRYNPKWLWTYSMPAPSYLDLEPNQLWYGPYITPLRKSPKLEGELKIGLKCSGNPKYDQDLHRSIPEKETIDCLPKNATIYSFHVDEDIKDSRVISLRDKIKTWDDTLDYLDQMDIIVSSCTSLPHAASAMGKKTIVIVPILNYYTWALPTKNTDWYSDNTMILRQKEYDNWNAPLAELKEYFDDLYVR